MCFKFWGSESFKVYFAKKDWGQWFSRGEKQKKDGLETMGCTAFSFADAVEAVGNYLKAETDFFDKFDLDFLQEKGYLNKDGKLNVSDRALAQEAGITKSGSDTKSIEGAAQRIGLVPESLWPWPDKVTWDSYYKPLPDYVYKLGKEWKNRFDISLERVDKGNYTKSLVKSPVLNYVYAWVKDGNGVYYRPESYGFNHAISIYAPPKKKIWPIRDSYPPFFKEVYDDNTYPFGYIIHLINHNYMDTAKFIQENDLKFIRNRETGQFGRIIRGALRVIEDDPSRAALMLLDDKVRDEGLNVSDKVWQKLPKKPF